MKKSISLCMIVKNEERFIEKCIQSVIGIVDEIIVVDTGSTDSTIDIANNYNAKVFKYEWEDDFAKARNYSLEQASSEYILILDADEYLDANINIQETLISNKDYYINRIKNYSSELFVRYHEAVRIFRNNIGLCYRGRIHEHLNIQDRDYSFSYSEILIHHDGYKEEVVRSKNKLSRNLNLLLKETKENPTGYNFFNLAKQYKQMNEINKALEYFTKSFNQSKTSNYLNELLYHMADCLRLLKRHQEGIELLKDAVSLFPNYTDLYYIQAKIYEEFVCMKEAEIAFLKCIELGEMEHTTTQGFGSYLAYYSLANVYLKMGDKLKASESLFQCIKLRNDFTDAILLYIKVLTETNIPFADIEYFLKNLFPTKNAASAGSLVTALYSLRHPLLIKFLNEYPIKVDDNILAVAELYAGNYNEAWDRWHSVNHLLGENIKDIILISAILKDNTLLVQHRNTINFNNNEWEILQNFVQGNLIQKKIKFSSKFEEILVGVSESLLIIKEYELFNYVSKWMLKTSIDTQYQLAKKLDDYGYYDTSIELSLLTLGNFPENKQFLKLLANTYIKNKQIDYGAECYKLLLEFEKDDEKISKIYKDLVELSSKLDEEAKRKLINVLAVYDTELLEKHLNIGKNQNAFFSIVIPTRQRHQYLKYCLKTCLEQDYDNYEIIVSDNQSSLETREIVDSFKSDKIVYIRTPELLNMSDNWEFALEHANGNYVIFLGDDDGLTLHSLKELNRIIKETNSRVIRWEQAFYGWPDVSIDHLVNRLSFSLRPVITNVNSTEMINSILERNIPYAKLPMLYNSVVHKDIIKELRFKAGRVFGSRSPDVYSGFAIAYLTKEYISISSPMHIGGASGMSNGIAQIHDITKNNNKQEFNSLNSNVGLKGNIRVPNLPTIATATYESFQDAKDHLFPNDDGLKINEKIMIKNIIKEFLFNRISKYNDEKVKQREWEFAYREILSTLDKSSEAIVWFKKEFTLKCPYIKSTQEKVNHKDFVGIYGDTILLNTNEFNVKDVYGVAKLIESILGYNRNGIRW